METVIYRIFIENWQRKLVALLTGLFIWFFVNHSISETKTIPGVPIHIKNLPSGKTILGLLPNGNLSKRITLTLTGTKDVISDLEAADILVEIDASNIDHDDWVAQISKKNLKSLNPSIDIVRHTSQVEHSEFLIRMRRLVTAKIPITILPPVGEAPQGYEFLDIWPQKLFQTVSGAEEEIQALKNKGLELTLDLSQVTKGDLDSIKNANPMVAQEDEVSFLVPNKWKQVAIPFNNNALEEINDPDAHYLRLDFLRKEFLPIENQVPIRVFFPLKYLETLNPETFKLAPNASIQQAFGLHLLTTPLYVKDVSRLFLNIVRENLEITIVAAPKSEREILHWSLQVINPHELEDTYVAFLIANNKTNKGAPISKRRETLLRKRFREYMQKLIVYTSPDHKLKLEGTLEGNEIKVVIEKK
jgi:hypothetical protein